MTPLRDGWQTFVFILALAAGTVLTRFLPFVFFSRRSRLPGVMVYLGRTLPSAAMALLLVYCLKDVRPLNHPYGLPEAVALLATATIHLWKRNTLISIAAGTLLYMFLVQTVLR